MSVDDPAAGFEERLRRLVELRKIEEQKYGDLLTALDRIWKVDSPQEAKPQLPEIKDNLNQSWDLTQKYLSVLEAEDRPFWKEVARSFRDYIEPLVQQQREVNSLAVHLLNEFSEAVQHSIEQIQTFHYTLIQYFQRIVPVVDTKFREMTGSAENYQVGLREYSDLMFQQLDKKILTMQVDLENLKSLQTSVRSLHQLANALGETPEPRKLDLQLPEFLPDEPEDFLLPTLEQFHNAGDAIVFCAAGWPLAAHCDQIGMKTTSENPVSYLQACKADSLNGILFATGLERFHADELLYLLRTAHSRMKTGAKIGLTAVNVGSAFAYLKDFLQDPSRNTPLHPQALKFLVSAVGFLNPRIEFLDDVHATKKLGLIPQNESPHDRLLNENFEKLNRLLFEPKHYALIAEK